ncbi:ABC transporter substrate-binding protein [Promicromonospora vindobonensis]|uniref:ABC transporter substrate-binding protein n=1 Tax=Promicromonospora vindobonensis TaxID=195748 RepID=A0ABW5VUL1_9MICO
MHNTADTMPRDRMSRRSFLGIGGIVLLGGGVLAGCAGGSGRAAADGVIEGTVRFAWWGNAARQEIYTEFAKGFEAVEPGVTVQVEPAEYSGYVDRLSVQAGGRNLPDTFWLPANQAASFADSGVLKDVATLPDGVLSLNDIPAAQVSSWEIAGKQVAPVYSQYSVCVQLDRTAFENAGISGLPDDESWTWDDLHDLAKEYSDATGEDSWGISSQASFYQHAHMWIRQHGAEAFDADGSLGFDADLLAGWFEWWKKGIDSGAVMPTEISGSETQWTQTGHRTGLYLVQLNQVRDNATFSADHQLELLKYPVEPGHPDDYQFRYYTRIAIAETSANAEEAGAFVNYMLNDPSGAEIVGIASGIPVNPKVVDRIREVGDDIDNQIIDMQDRIDQQPMRERPEPPPAGADWQLLIETAADNIFNGGQAIDEAVQTALTELQTQLDRG